MGVGVGFGDAQQALDDTDADSEVVRGFMASFGEPSQCTAAGGACSGGPRCEYRRDATIDDRINRVSGSCLVEQIDDLSAAIAILVGDPGVFEEERVGLWIEKGGEFIELMAGELVEKDPKGGFILAGQ